MTAHMSFDRIERAGMTQRMRYQSELPMIQMFPSTQQFLAILELSRLSFDISVKIFDRSSNNFGLVDQKVCHIVIVIFAIKKRAVVFRWCAPQNVRYRNEFKEPVLVPQHGPVKQRTSRTAVPVNKWMVIGRPEMQQNRPNRRVNKEVWNRAVREFTH